MKYWLPVVLLLVAVAGGVFLFQSQPVAPPAAEPAPIDHAFLHPAPIDLPFGVSKADYAGELFQAGRYDDVVAVWADVYGSTHSAETQATAVLMAGQAFTMKNTPEARTEASRLFNLYLHDFSGEGRADIAEYNLGRLAMEAGDFSRALLYFTTLLEDYPGSTFAPGAAYAARYIAAGMAGQDRTLRGRMLARIEPLLPRNTAALLSMMTSSITLLIWLAYDWQNHYKRLVEQKDPVLWGIIILLVGLATANYILEDQRNALSTVEALKALGKVKQ